jgi:hypothetical protein
MKWGLANGGSGLLHRAGERRKLADFSDGSDRAAHHLDRARPRIRVRIAGRAASTRLPERSTTAASTCISRTPRFIAFVAHLLAAEITL